MKYCPHNFLIPTELVSRQSASQSLEFGPVSPYCSDCWSNPAVESFFNQLFFDKSEVGKPYVYGFCDLITQVAKARGFSRDAHGRESKEMDLRIRLMDKQSTIKAAIAGKDSAFTTNYVRRVLKNYLTNEQTGSEGVVVSNSIKSLSPDTARTDRKMLANSVAGERLTELTGGSITDDDFSLDERDVLAQAAPDDSEEVNKPKKRTPRKEARHLFDSLMAEASSQIATLTGGRKDGFDTHLDLERALDRIPDDERRVFSAIFLENGELLNRPRSYADAEFLTGLSTQNVRTLERKAIDKLRPALAPAFFKRRACNR